MPQPIKNKVAVILQARTGSSRLPGKVLADLAGRPMLGFLLERLKRCNSVDHFILATTDLGQDNSLVEFGQNINMTIARGSQNDVLSRYASAAKLTDANILIRITGDCPLIAPYLLDVMIDEFIEMDVDYYSNCAIATYPDGLDIEIFSRNICSRKQM